MWKCNVCGAEFETRVDAVMCCPDIIDLNPAKTVIVDQVEYHPGLSLCNGCPHLTVATHGWECFYEPQSKTCAYPDALQRAAKALYNGPAA